MPLRVPHLLLFCVLALSSCFRSGAPSGPGDSTGTERQVNAVREQLAEIPPPSKTRYLAIKSLTSWENPYLTVQGNMATLHVTLADGNPSTIGNGGLLRPVGARRQDLNVRISDLPAALNAVPQTAWPYGRVVAIEEAHDIPPSARAEVRRNLESALKMLGDLGVVVYEWQEGGPGLH